MNTPEKNSIAAIILSGGRGSRFGSIDKGLQDYNGKALVAWVIEAVSPQVGKIILSINRNQDQYQRFNLATAEDEDGNFGGPIAGILSCALHLQKQGFDYFLIASCDSPKLSNHYVDRLYKGLNSIHAEVAMVNDGKRNQHLHCLIKTAAIDKLKQYYENGGRSMHGWLKEVKFTEVDFSDLAECYININTADELSLLEKQTF